MNHRIRRRVTAAALATLLAQGAWAQTADEGRLLASGCFQCHGTNGVNGSFGTLAGAGRQDLLNKLNDMRGKAARANIMYPHARGYTNQQLALIADYFARQPKP
ncbi:MAG: cytochrome C [Burkholderiales bacterium]|nr:cytochrome C [Burkholderiales bacterium]